MELDSRGLELYMIHLLLLLKAILGLVFVVGCIFFFFLRIEPQKQRTLS